uniref:Reverse transcriptase domain-containing protein n=1 Tax=Tanacetum cinerariifolium TaxID=118510 RepID=A0A699KBH9_TANCI|nr:hypothetical protein [Tanacetum cinerariifolium]
MAEDLIKKIYNIANTPGSKVIEDILSRCSFYSGKLECRRSIKFRERIVGNKMHKAFPLPGESSHWQYKFPLPVEGVPTARRMEILLLGVCTDEETASQR